MSLAWWARIPSHLIAADRKKRARPPAKGRAYFLVTGLRPYLHQRMGWTSLRSQDLRTVWSALSSRPLEPQVGVAAEDGAAGGG
jgi:hypothetical protein